MPFSYSIDSAAGLVEVVGDGPTSTSSWIAAMEASVLDPAYRRGMPFLFARREMLALPSSADLLQGASYLDAVAARIGPCRLALVVNGGAAAVLGQIVATLVTSSILEMVVFTDRDEARRWLLAGNAIDPAGS